MILCELCVLFANTTPEKQYEVWAYSAYYEATGEGAGLQAVRSAAEALLIDETNLHWVHATTKGSRLLKWQTR